MRTAFLPRLINCTAGTAAVEMALVTPILMVLMFGAFDLGNYFLQQHIVTKAVRDGARYAGRQSFAEFAGCTPSSTVEQRTRNITRTGIVANGGTPRIANWTNPASITVAAACDTSGTYTGIYTDVAIGAPRVTVSAMVTYNSLFGQFGLLTNATVNMRAQSESAVMGV
ncbi:MAG: pilus assembly protein [Sphingomonadaceae bacterium]|nr:pilus assembly protein [Sphingomonadaceae bacterium]